MNNSAKPARQVRESSNGYVARLRKDGLMMVRAELVDRDISRRERREREAQLREQRLKELKEATRLRLIPRIGKPA